MDAPTDATPAREGRWSTLDTRTVHAGRVRITERDVLLPGGERIRFEVDESIPFAVAVLVVTEDGDVLLARQYRYPIDRWIYDLPGGAGGDDEAPAEAARRECREEIGLLPDALVPLHVFYPNPGRAAWPVHLYLARGGTPSERDETDPAEQVRLVRMPLAALDALIAEGAVVDPSLLLARMMAGVRGELPALG